MTGKGPCAFDRALCDGGAEAKGGGEEDGVPGAAQQICEEVKRCVGVARAEEHLGVEGVEIGDFGPASHQH